MAQVSYAFATGNVRAKETALLTKQDMEQLLAAEDIGRFCELLRGKGYGDGLPDGAPFDVLVKAQRRALWTYIRQIAPDFSVFEPFLLQNDYHNLKVLLKGTLTGRPVDSLLLEPYTVAPQTLRDAVEARSFTKLPAHMQAAAARAYELLAHSSDPALADGILDAALFAAQSEAARASGSALLARYFRADCFYRNIKIVLRCARAGKGREFLTQVLCETPDLPPKELFSAAAAGVEEVLALMERLDKFESAAAAQAYRASPGTFERFCDDVCMRIAKAGKTVTVGVDALIGYLVAKETELAEISIIASGIRTGQPVEQIRERGRLLYV